jgi:hypothetical protein
MARADVPQAVSLTRQFATLCPDGASCMYLPLARTSHQGPE